MSGTSSTSCRCVRAYRPAGSISPRRDHFVIWLVRIRSSTDPYVGSRCEAVRTGEHHPGGHRRRDGAGGPPPRSPWRKPMTQSVWGPVQREMTDLLQGYPDDVPAVVDQLTKLQ